MTRPSTRNTEVLGREAVIRSFLGSLTVEPVRASRLVKLHVDNTDPQLAARIANTTVQAFIAMGMERRLEASSYAKTFLESMAIVKDFWAEPSYAPLLQASQKRFHDYVVAGQGTAKDALDSLVKHWSEIFQDDGKM